MQATQLDTAALVSAVAAEAQVTQPEQGSQLITELGALELALVGGGSGAVSFY